MDFEQLHWLIFGFFQNKKNNCIIKFLYTYRYPLFLIAAILLCLWPLTFHVFILKWDNTNAYLPYHYFVSDALWNGHMPLWNPFQHLGYPIYSDPQSGTWNFITWIIMLFGKYTMGSLITELLSYFVIAGLGMFWFCKNIYQHQPTAFIIALCYALSGMMVGSAQLMVFVAGVAWLPWCLLTLLKFSQTFQLKYMVFSALFFAMNTTSASPAYTIILVYIYLGVFGYFFWKNRNQWDAIKKIFFGGTVFSVTLVVLLLPYINAFVEFSDYFNRLEKLPYSKFLLSNPFVLVDYLSFLFPYSVISASKIFEVTDLSLRNGYFGLIGVLGVVFSLLYARNKKTLLLVVGIVFFLLLAAGDGIFIYKIAYHLPGFGVFRHPSFFRSYALFLLLILSGYGLHQLLKRGHINGTEKRIIIGFGLLFLIAGSVAFYKTSVNEIIDNVVNVFNYVEFSTSLLSTHIFINVVVVFFILGIILLLKKVVRFSLFTAILLFTILDLGIQTQLTFPTTICHDIAFSTHKTYFDNLPNEINQKDNHQPLKYFDERQGLAHTKGLWKNMSTFNKTISYEGYNPFKSKNFEAAQKSEVLERNLQNPIIFSPTKVYQEGDTLQQGLIWNTPSSVQIIEDALRIDSVEIGYNSFTARVKNSADKKQWLLLNQNYHHLWKAHLGNVALPVHFVNDLIMGVEIPPNSEGKIDFSFASPRSIYFGIISLLGYLFIGFYFFFSKKQLN